MCLVNGDKGYIQQRAEVSKRNRGAVGISPYESSKAKRYMLCMASNDHACSKHFQIDAPGVLACALVKAKRVSWAAEVLGAFLGISRSPFSSLFSFLFSLFSFLFSLWAVLESP
jgi:hypothetical protein